MSNKKSVRQNKSYVWAVRSAKNGRYVMAKREASGTVVIQEMTEQQYDSPRTASILENRARKLKSA